jgi:hypothetical protein
MQVVLLSVAGLARVEVMALGKKICEREGAG